MPTRTRAPRSDRGHLPLVTLALVAATWLGGCGVSTPSQSRAEQGLTACLDDAGLRPTAGVGGRALEQIFEVEQMPHPASLETVEGVAILSYRSPRGATEAFDSGVALIPILAQGDRALVLENQTPEPTVRVMRSIERCALRDPRAARVSGEVTDVPFPVPAPQPTCRLTATYLGSGGAAGTYIGEFRVHNLAASRCALYRYPRLTMLYGAGRPRPQAQSDGDNGAFPAEPFLFDLAGHATTQFAIAFGLAGDSPVGACTRPTATGVVISAGPDARATAMLAPPFSKQREPLGECPGISVGAFGPL